MSLIVGPILGTTKLPKNKINKAYLINPEILHIRRMGVLTNKPINSTITDDHERKKKQIIIGSFLFWRH